MFARLSVIAGLFIAAASASNVLELTPDNFDKVIGQGKPALVEFYAPWCGHCKNLAPIYEQVADAYSHAKDKVIIAKVDADGVGKPLGKKYGVTGFPTLQWFGPDGGEPEKYEGSREADPLLMYILGKTNVKPVIKKPAGATLVLDSHTFDDVVMDKEKDVLVTFTAPWCGHCKRLKPIYDDVAKAFLPESNCVVANVDADSTANAPLAQKYEISSFPTIKFFPKDNKEGETYDGGRSEEDFVNFLNKRCGTHRAVGGGLNAQAGRVAELDDLASKFISEAVDARNALFEQATALGSGAGSTGQYYLRVMEKVLKGSEEYITKEAARLASILKKRTLNEAKMDEIKIKANILAAFVERKAENISDAVKETVGETVERAREEL